MTFQGRIARVGLITSVVVLLAACATFMLQQWAVERAQSRLNEQSSAQITADMAASAVARQDVIDYQTAVAALRANKRIVSARLTDTKGATLALYAAEKPPAGDREPVTKEVRQGATHLGELPLVVAQPPLAPTLAKYIALTFILLFGGVGVALFLARSLAH